MDQEFVTLNEISQIVNQAILPLRATVDKIDGKVDTLYTERFSRSDGESMRRDFMAQLDTISSRYMTKELSEQRYKEMEARITQLTSRLDNFENDRETTNRQLLISTIGWGITIIGLIIGVFFQVISHMK